MSRWVAHRSSSVHSTTSSGRTSSSVTWRTATSIAAAFEQRGEQPTLVDDELDRRRRVHALEAPEDAGHAGGAHLLVRPDLDRAGELGALEPVDDPVVGLRRSSVRVVEQDSAIACRAQRVTVADQERAADALLEPLDLPAHRRLRESEVLCGAGHAAPIEHCSERAERLHVELHRTSLRNHDSSS